MCNSLCYTETIVFVRNLTYPWTLYPWLLALNLFPWRIYMFYFSGELRLLQSPKKMVGYIFQEQQQVHLPVGHGECVRKFWTIKHHAAEKMGLNAMVARRKRPNNRLIKYCNQMTRWRCRTQIWQDLENRLNSHLFLKPGEKFLSGGQIWAKPIQEFPTYYQDKFIYM